MKFLGVWSVVIALVCASIQTPSNCSTTPAPAPDAHAASGSIRLHSTHPLSFHYKTPFPHKRNWIAVYNSSYSAAKYQTQNQSSLLWDYAFERDGIIKFPNNKLSDGNYTAVFFEDDGYHRAAEPLSFHFKDALPGKLEAISTEPLILKYSTAVPNSKNWIGLYPASGGGPENEEWSSDALSYKYAPDDLGTVVLSTIDLANGSYKAFFLANDGYKWAGAPVELQLGSKSTGYPGSFKVTYKLKKKKASLLVNYACKEPNEKNWIGIWYSYGGGPEHEIFVDEPLAWGYASETDGHVTISVDKLDRTRPYKVFFLSNNGYKWLSPPAQLGLRQNTDPMKFMVDPLNTHAARQGSYWELDISGMLNYPGDPRTRFVFADNDEGWMKIDWLRGKVYGTPGPKEKNLTVTVMAHEGPWKTFIDLKTPVRKASMPLVEQLRVLTWNLWDGGEPIKEFHEKQIKRITELNVDIVGFQESGRWHGARIAYTLGWHHWQGDNISIISRYPLAQVYSAGSGSGAVRISLDGDKVQIVVWNCHLSDATYGPYQFCFDGASTDKVLEREVKSERTKQIRNITERMKGHLANADKVPVLLMGDFNSPSHLDWTDSTKERHCGAGAVPWPASKYPHDVGLVDTFRVAHPDPETDPGVTWSPTYLNNNGRPEPMDRTDFIYYKGSKLNVTSSETIMVDGGKPEPNHRENRWPSDHMAVLTVFKIRSKGVEGRRENRQDRKRS